MIVCICHGVGCGAIRAAVRSGAASVEAVGDCCGAGTDCGACRDEIASLIDEVSEERAGASASGRRHLQVAPASCG